MTGELVDSSGGSRIGTVDDVVISPCNTYLNFARDLRWLSETVEIHAESRSGDVTTGYLDGVTMSMSGTSCDARFEGTIPFEYANSSDVLTFDTVSSGYGLTSVWVNESANCFGLISEGETFEITGEYVVSPGQDIVSEATPAAPAERPER